MKGIHKVVISTKYLKYEFDLRRNLTIIRGDSATGKTTLVDMVRTHMNDGDSGPVTLNCDKSCYVVEGNLWKGQLGNIQDSIVFIDEGNKFVKTKDFARAIQQTDVSLREACDRVKKERVLEVIEIANKACKDMGIENPRIAVAGLNPHCGENGLFGREEIEEITPAIEAAKAEGITGVVGPCPPDSVFSQALGGWYDIVVCMYHDQGHIPLKTVGFVYDREKQEWKAVEGVNVTLGLPIIRASVDHGTDFYHAGKGNGNELSLVNAIKYAVKMTGRK